MSGQSSLILGALLTIWFAVPRRLLGLISGFGAGALVSAAAFELTVPAFRSAGEEDTAIWLAIGAIQAFAAGTILTMLAAVMMPAAYEDGREAVDLAFVLGFAVLAFLSTKGR